MGTPEFSATILKTLYQADYDVQLVVTQPDKFVGRKKVLTASPVKEVASELGISLFQPSRIRDDFQTIVDYQPDLIITAAYGQILPKHLLEMPSLGCINLHASLLPKYRGGAPIQRAIINGENETGISLMYMDEKMDTGDVIAVKKIAILDEDTSDSLFKKLAGLASELLLEQLPLICEGKNDRLEQNHTQATYAWNLSKEDEFISFNRDVKAVYNQIRGLLSNPGAYGVISGKKIKFHQVSYQYSDANEASIFMGLDEKGIKVSAQNGFIYIQQIQLEGKSSMDSKSFYNGLGKQFVGVKFNETFKD